MKAKSELVGSRYRLDNVEDGFEFLLPSKVNEVCDDLVGLADSIKFAIKLLVMQSRK